MQTHCSVWAWPDQSDRSPQTAGLRGSSELGDSPHLLFPVALVVSRERTHATLDDFVAYLAEHKYTVADGRVTYTFKDDLGAATTLELGGKLPVPRGNEKPVDLYPQKVFDSPYLSSDSGSGVVTIQKGDRKLVLDLNQTDTSE